MLWIAETVHIQLNFLTFVLRCSKWSASLESGRVSPCFPGTRNFPEVFPPQRKVVYIFSSKKSFLDRMESLPVTNQDTIFTSLPFSGESSEHSLLFGCPPWLWHITNLLKLNTTARHVGGWKWSFWFVWPQLHLFILETYSSTNIVEYKTTEPKHFLTGHTEGH